MGKTELKCDCEIVHKDKVKKAQNSQLLEKQVLSMVSFYKALSDSTRIKIIGLLEKNELCVCDIAYLLNVTKSTISHQLKYLKDLNIVKCKKTGKEVFYTLSDSHIKQIFNVSVKHMEECKNEN